MYPAITADTSLRLARYFGFSPEYWFNMQAHYDLEIIRPPIDWEDREGDQAARRNYYFARDRSYIPEVI